MNMPLVLLNRRRRGNVFTPSGLFALAEPGVWYDPSDLTTLFQDTAGTTPVTTPGQTVALALDKSKGLVLGSELVTNGTFNTNVTGWNSTGLATVAWDADNGGSALVNITGSGGGLVDSQALTVVPGRTYVVSASVRLGTYAGSLFLNCDSTAFTISPTASYQTFTRYYVAADTDLDLSITRATAATGTIFIDNISVKELAGAHATQSTAASRPTYGIVPSGGRRNLLTYSEQFDNAAWTKSRASVTANTAIAPDGTTTADKLVEDSSASNTHRLFENFTHPASTYSWSVSCKAAERSFVYLRLTNTAGVSVGAYFNLSNGTVGTTESGVTASISTQSSGWYRCAITVAAQASPIAYIGVASADNTQTYTGDGTSGILIWGAQLETGSTATAYQRVGSAFDVTEAGVQSLSYLSFDGVDDFLVTPTITPGVDKAQVFAGVRKLSDAAVATIAEHSINSGSTTGTWGLFASGYSASGAAYAANLFGSQRSSFDATTFTSPTTNVLSATFDIAQATRAAEIGFKVNGSVPTLTGGGFGDAGTGNFTAQAIYIGRRNGTVFPFNGNIFSLVVRFGANLDASTITNTERWVGGKTGVTI